jgi:sec-independent protein translocase protein TatC
MAGSGDDEEADAGASDTDEPTSGGADDDPGGAGGDTQDDPPEDEENRDHSDPDTEAETDTEEGADTAGDEGAENGDGPPEEDPDGVAGDETTGGQADTSGEAADGDDDGEKPDGDLDTQAGDETDDGTEDNDDDGDDETDGDGPQDRSGEPDGGGGLVGSGPQTDEEMPLTSHIEEMVRRLGVVAIVGAIATVVAFPLGEEAINFLWYSILPGTDVAKPHLYNPLELVFAQLKVASLVGLVAALPVLVYQTYRFMRPGLYPQERRYYLAAIPASLVLAFVGLTFAYFVVLPAVFTYFYSYSQEVTLIAFSLGQTFNLILVLMGYLAIVFQIPLLVMLAIMMGITSREWLAGRRLLFWSGFAGVAFLLSPDPTGVSPIIIAVTMILLFEGSLQLAKWTGN